MQMPPVGRTGSVLAVLALGVALLAPMLDPAGHKVAAMIFVVLVLALLLAVYFLPALIARDRKHHNAAAIFVLNLLLGWTLLGWVAALIWAFAQPATVSLEGAGSATAARRAPCPFCAEPILVDARLCRFCGRKLASGWGAPSGRTEPHF
jgi:Superinfection immunity protein